MAAELWSVEYFKEYLAKDRKYSEAVFIGFMGTLLNPELARDEDTPAKILKRARNLMKAYEDLKEGK